MTNSMQLYYLVSLLCYTLTCAQGATSHGESETHNVDKCSLPIEPGMGTESLVRYGFNGVECIAFTYAGLGGNANRFPISQECEAECKK
ncbi:Kunitz-type U15-theraphotoxin-Hhn1l [Clonorchis sinensis]|uniref:Kunitz-type U15-theraphotoxin-Hhn1l n=2 Tax=Clonorchis sinensis TaxID=79923 RepID=A0A8T1MWN5_CLOSI|nr:Kunitz-type U15-theraphotoxin-Hhn1l [Clonorchis sinensis]GAA52396.1 hainantoxin-XI-12 [Clonorchis sinensis]